MHVLKCILPISLAIFSYPSRSLATEILQNSNLQVQVADSLSSIEKIISNPIVQNFLNFFSNPAVSQTIERTLSTSNRKTFLFSEIGWLFFFLFFRGWHLARLAPANWIKGIWIRIWTFTLYVGTSFILIPWAFVGEPYLSVLRGLYRLLNSIK
jgi:hypothetical protein